MPKFLAVEDDCYRVPKNGGPVTRVITYRLFDDSAIPMFFSHATVWEHLTGDIPASGADSPSAGSGGTFEDEQSIVNFMGQTTQSVSQRFSAVMHDGSGDVSVFVRGFGGDYGTLGIWKTNDVIYINGNAGGKVGRDGKLIPGTYKQCD